MHTTDAGSAIGTSVRAWRFCLPVFERVILIKMDSDGLIKSVLIICRDIDQERFGGAHSTRERIRAAAQLGCRVYVLSRFRQGGQRLVAGGVDVERLALPALFDRSISRYSSPSRVLAHIRAGRALVSWARLHRPTAIFVIGERPVWPYLSLQDAAPLYYCRQDSAIASVGSLRNQLQDPRFGREPLIRRLFLLARRHWESRRVCKITHFVANSRYIARIHGRLDAIIQYPPVVPEAPRPLGSEVDRARLNRLIFVGRLESAKGPDHALRVLSLLPSAYTLLMVGDGDSGWLRRLAFQLEVLDRVLFAGPLPNTEVRSRLKASGVTLVPSMIDEAFGRVGIESFACGTPAVAYDVGGIAEWCQEPAGILVSRGDCRAAAQAVLAITSDEQKWRRRSEAAVEMFQREFGYERFVQSMRDLLGVNGCTDANNQQSGESVRSETSLDR